MKTIKTSPEKVAEMVRMIGSGMSITDVARHMGVSRCTVARYTGWNPVKRRAYADPAPALRMETWYRSYVYPDWQITKRIWAEDYGDGTYGWWCDYTTERISSGEVKVHNSLMEASEYVKEEAQRERRAVCRSDRRCGSGAR